MVRKCSVIGCKSNYASQKDAGRVTIYGFPSKKEDLHLWLSSLPNKIDPSRVTDNMGVCANHFSPDCPMMRRGRYFIPTQPPPIFYNVPLSSISTPPPKPRPTSKSSSKNRNHKEDETAQFMEMDCFGFLAEFWRILPSKLSGHLTVSEDLTFIVWSRQRKGAIHDFTIYCDLKVTSDLTVTHINCEAYKGIRKESHSLFPSNTVRSWSQFEEILRHLNVNSGTPGTSEKVAFILRQVDLLNMPRNTRLYDIDDLCLGLSWSTRSRSLYNELQKYLQLPSISTLTKITRTAKNTSDDDVFCHVFSNQEERQKCCVLIIDEIYVKASLSYRGGVLFGYAVDQPKKMATTLLCIMVKCLFEGKKFLAKLLPCSALTSNFQFSCVQSVISSLEESGAKVLAVINDNNRVNQAFYRLFTPISAEAPWIVQSHTDSSQPMFLLYDPVHLMKNIRNNWLIEKTETIRFHSSNGEILAKWSDLIELYQSESASLLKLSKLTKSSVSPSHIEKQKVCLALKVFCDETCAALQTSHKRTESWLSTALFIKEVVQLWKLLNCKAPFQDVQRRDPHKVAIDLSANGTMARQLLTDWANRADTMKPKDNVRFQCFSRDTADALAWTCRCLLDLSTHLLTIPAAYGHDFVCLGFFQQDDLEQHFGYFRMAAGCNYYLSVQDIINTHSKDKDRLMLTNIPDLDYSTNNTHHCELCNSPLSDSGLLLLDDMADGAVSISEDEKQAAFYVAGYIAFKHPELVGTPQESNSAVAGFLCELSRGSLSYPSNELYTWAILSYTYFTKSSGRFCKNDLVSLLTSLSDDFHLDFIVPKDTVKRFVNILMKRFCLVSNQDNTQQQPRKIVKLSSVSQK